MSKGKKPPRKRCPWCGFKQEDLRAHIEEDHFPRHCSVCLKTIASHPHSDTSPLTIFPCPGGAFVV